MPAKGLSCFSPRRFSSVLGSFTLALMIICTYYYTLLPIHDNRQATALHPTAAGNEPSELPNKYSAIPVEEPFCAERFGTTYLHKLHDSATHYCNGSSALTCFHSQTMSDRWDSFCFTKGAKFKPANGQFHIDCELGDPKSPDPGSVFQRPNKEFDDWSRFPRPDEFHRYWYDTGPIRVFEDWIKMDKETQELLETTPNYTILIKREGGHNVWHCLIEIYSMTLSMDILQMTSELESPSQPFITKRDAANTQVVILDNHDDGPYFDLWSLFAKKPVLHLRDLPANTFENIIIPLPSATNTLWQGDWEINPCEKSALLETFAKRGLSLYGLNDTKPRQNKEITFTFINRVDGRKLVGGAEYLQQLQEDHPLVKVQSVDFATIPYKDQLKIIQETDILAGVHGAGLTHSIFLPPGSAMVEILPPTLNHKGFRNVAALRGHSYFSTHGIKPASAKNGDWHGEDVYIESERFMSVMDMAIKSMYNKGLRSYDVS